MRRLRKQYYFRAPAQSLLTRDVDRLIELCKDFPRRHIRITNLGAPGRK
jgi:hypothetical protein